MPCAVCASDADPEALLTCTSCGVQVHAECYHPTHALPAATELFTCQSCAAGKPAADDDATPTQNNCSLCGRSGGALVATAEGAWAHGVCALYLSGASLVSVGDRLVAYGIPDALMCTKAEIAAAAERATSEAAAAAAKAAATKATAAVKALAPPPARAAPARAAPVPTGVGRTDGGCQRDARCVRTNRHVGRCKIEIGACTPTAGDAASATQVATDDDAAPPSAGESVPAARPASVASGEGPAVTDADAEDAEAAGEVEVVEMAKSAADEAEVAPMDLEESGAPAPASDEPSHTPPAPFQPPSVAQAGEAGDDDGAPAAADPDSSESPAAAPAAAPSSERADGQCCVLCGGGGALIRCCAVESLPSGGGDAPDGDANGEAAPGTASAADAPRPPSSHAAVCTSMVHPNCALEAGLSLGSCPHFGAELYYYICKAHAADASVRRPRAPQRALPTRHPLAVGAAGDDAGGGEGKHAGEHAGEHACAPRYTHAHEGRATKNSKLMQIAQTPYGITNTVAAMAAERAVASGGDWWWALRVDLVPPLLEPSVCGEGSVRLGADGRRWRVVATVQGAGAADDAPAQAEEGGETEPARIADGWVREDEASRACECLWAPLAPNGTIATPAQLPPPPAAMREGGRPERLSRGLTSRPTFGGVPVDELALLGGERGGGWGHGGFDGEDDGGGFDGGGMDGGALGSTCDARYAGGRFVEGRYELPEAAVDWKLFGGAFREGWVIRESYHNSRAVGTWQYIGPDGTKYRTKTEAMRASGHDGDDESERRNSWGSMGRGRGRGGGRGRGRASRGGGGGYSLPVVSGEYEGVLVRLVASKGGHAALADSGRREAEGDELVGGKKRKVDV